MTYPEPPKEYLCCLSKKLMKDPVRSPNGHHFERSVIEAHLEKNEWCPVTGNPMKNNSLVPNKSLQWSINSWRFKE